MRIPTAILASCVLAACSKPDTSAMRDFGRIEVDFPNGTRIMADPARSQREILQGLRYYDSLPSDHGMLFIYAKEESHPFWAYQAKFAVDIIWMDKDRRIVEMNLNTPPCPSQAAHECPTFGGHKESRYVLEVRAGIASQNSLRYGDRLDF